MSYPDNCAQCGESYDSDNLMTCTACRRDVCYRCFGQRTGQCARCSPAAEASVPPEAPGTAAD